MARVFFFYNLWPDCEGPPKQAPPVGYRDPSSWSEKEGARLIKATLGITALSRQRSLFFDAGVCDLDVELRDPGVQPPPRAGLFVHKSRT